MNKFLIAALFVLPATLSIADETQTVQLTCPRPVTPGCEVTLHGLIGATCTESDYNRNLGCFDTSVQQKMQYEEVFSSQYPNN